LFITACQICLSWSRRIQFTPTDTWINGKFTLRRQNLKMG